MLTSKQELFTLDLFKGLSETDAYKNNYSVSNMSIEAIYVEACRLRANPKISLRLQELRKPGETAIIASRDELGETYTLLFKDNETKIRDKVSVGREISQLYGYYEIQPLVDARTLNIYVIDTETKELMEKVKERTKRDATKQEEG
ncbi:hypothetical protein LCGC14_1144330 [marine sediment metagenome]|uniref:Uncharacterized protein n=1 Tax=marine sediment metagenome TaxID=412755 RepID=A0A0F9M273_9ZZZZ